MPARQKKRIKRKRGRKSFGIRPIYIFFLFLISLVTYLFLGSDYKGRDKISVAIVRESGDIQISTFDWKLEEITNVIIPGNTEVEVARHLGTFQIKNVWQLGINEDLDGLLLAETLTRHFKFPVTAWADKKAKGLADGNLVSKINAVLVPYKTNLKMGDRLKLAAFSIGVNSSKRVDVNLADTSYLIKRRFIDGNEGYYLFGGYPDQLRVVFSSPIVSAKKVKVIIKDRSGQFGVAKNIGEVVEILGAKVISIDRLDVSETDCLMGGKEKEILEIFSKLFSCQNKEMLEEGNIDIEIEIGSQFAERY